MILKITYFAKHDTSQLHLIYAHNLEVLEKSIITNNRQKAGTSFEFIVTLR